MWDNIEKLKKEKAMTTEMVVVKKVKPITCLYKKRKKSRARFNKGEKLKTIRYKTGNYTINFD
tara:strand:+ start:68 stop:256 length:189 start_codon:yes stop_codon:yes gene_type:complete